MEFSKHFFTIAIGLTAIGLTSCETIPRHAEHLVPPNATIYYVKVAPPPKPEVIRPTKPSSKAVWIDGYWSWTGLDYTWAKGYWTMNAPKGQSWKPGQWIETERGWYRRPGCWSELCEP